MTGNKRKEFNEAVRVSGEWFDKQIQHAWENYTCAFPCTVAEYQADVAYARENHLADIRAALGELEDLTDPRD